jgi:hypothetical protein
MWLVLLSRLEVGLSNARFFIISGITLTNQKTALDQPGIWMLA